MVCRYSVCWLVCHTSEPCKNGWTKPIEMPYGFWAWMAPKNRIRWGPDPPWERVILRGGRGTYCKVSGLSAVSCAKMAELINLPFVLWTSVVRRKHGINCIHQVAPMCPHWRADWRHLANTIEPSVFFKLLWPLVIIIYLLLFSLKGIISTSQWVVMLCIWKDNRWPRRKKWHPVANRLDWDCNQLLQLH